ncbi:MAG: hypothetical protein K0R17_1941 [Rariglobus sp.]|jgi:hypothetical protein|nr:hypothetical protein [Rariglobus sp.]
MKPSPYRRLYEYAFVLVIIMILAAVILPTIGHTCGGRGGRFVDGSNLRQIGQATLIYASGHNDRLPVAEDVWDYARQLAEGGGLDEARLWQSTIDPASTPAGDKKLKVLLPSLNGQQPRELNPAFRKVKPAFAVALGKITTNSPATTPIAWTRGLQPDGTWAKHSPYGTAGGYIYFLGGNVAFYLNLSGNGGELIGRDGNKTANIFDALPRGCRIGEYMPTPAEEAQWARITEENKPRSPSR